MKFLIDMPLSPTLVDWLAQLGHVAIHASDVGLFSASDESIIAYAVQHACVILTADLDYPRLLALGRLTSPGVILFRGGQFSEREVTALLARLFDVMDIEELPTSLVVIEQKRIRRRRPPIL